MNSDQIIKSYVYCHSFTLTLPLAPHPDPRCQCAGSSVHHPARSDRLGLILKQHGLELPGSTYTWGFFKVSIQFALSVAGFTSVGSTHCGVRSSVCDPTVGNLDVEGRLHVLSWAVYRRDLSICRGS